MLHYVTMIMSQLLYLSFKILYVLLMVVLLCAVL